MKFKLLVIYALISLSSFSQKGLETWVEGRFKAGFLVAHRSSMGHLVKEHAYAGEVKLFVKPNHEKKWYSSYRNPIFGISLFGGTVGNMEVLGSFYGVYPFVHFPLIKQKFYRFSIQVGSGLGYGTKVYDSESNITNVAMSTHLNALICLGLESRFSLGEHDLTFNLDMTHFSNGATKIPNLGVNIPYVSLGYAHKIKEASKFEEVEDEFKPHFEFGAMTIGSVQEVNPTGARKYPFFGLNLITRRYFSRKSAMEASFDIFSKQSILAHHPDVEKRQIDIIQLGIYAGYIMPMDKLHIIFGMGAYVRDKYSPVDALYHRVGFRYRLDNGLNFNLTLKSHWARADYVEYGIGYTFKK